MLYPQCIVFVAMLFQIQAGECSDKKPHIVVVMADDLGYNDVGYHEMNQIETPCIDRLARAGTRLENYYVQPICSPTRSQLLSGRYQIHTGLQHGVILPDRPFGLPLDNVLLPQQLKSCGYRTHMVGKWHLGFFKKEYLPWKRGFDNFTGILTGGADHYTHIKDYHGISGKSMYDSTLGPTTKYSRIYSTALYTRKSINIISNHDKSSPLFLYLAFQAPHAPLQPPRKGRKRYKHIKDRKRRTFAQMVSSLDSSVCKIVTTLRKKKMWKDTILVFSSDNGGQPTHGGNNWPLRGRKGTMWEGGIRAVGFVNGGFEIRRNVVSHQLLHVSDWMPTLMAAANCPLQSGTLPLDGISQWGALTRGEASPREEILHNIDPLSVAFRKKNNAVKNGFDTRIKAAIRKGPWKLLTGQPGDGDWIQPSELKGRIISVPKHHKLFQLYNIELDPYEKREMSSERPDIVNDLLARLAHYNNTAVPVWFPPRDIRSSPARRDGFWGPWL